MSRSKQIIKLRSISIRSKTFPNLKLMYKTSETSLKQHNNQLEAKDSKRRLWKHQEAVEVWEREEPLAESSRWPCKLRVTPKNQPGEPESPQEEPRTSKLLSVKNWRRPGLTWHWQDKPSQSKVRRSKICERRRWTNRSNYRSKYGKLMSKLLH